MTTIKPSKQQNLKAVFFFFFGIFVLSPQSCVYALDFKGSLKGITINDSKGSNIAPTAVIKYTHNGDSIDFDARGSSDSDGNILEYRWDFADGSTGIGATITHDFPASGSFPVTLTTIDNGGAIALSQITVISTPSVWINASGSPTPWSLFFADSEETAREDGRAVNAFDGNKGTLWVTEWSTSDPPPPHEIQIDLGGLYAIDGFSYLPRQDGVINGTIAQYEIFISRDTREWGGAVSTGTFSDDTTEKVVNFPVSIGRYIRLKALSEMKGRPWTSVAEIDIYGSYIK